MMIYYLKVVHPEIYEKLQRREPISVHSLAQLDLVSFYKTARKLFEADEANFQDHSRAEVVRLQHGDEDSRNIWMYLCNISRVEFQKVYDLLNVRLEERGESFYNPYLAGLVESLTVAGVARKSEGAIVAYPEGAPADPVAEEDSAGRGLVLQKTDGGYLYATTDLAALRYRLAEGEGDDADEVLYVTDSGQASHFDM
jgi:arginyl-tRNA synthetase